jgi:hypothetical protein
MKTLPTVPRFERGALVVALAGTIIMAGAGCRSAPHPGVVVEHQPGDGVCTRKVPYDATYALYALNPDGSETVPIDRASVEKREHVGFVFRPDGTLAAYAGGRKIHLSEGWYVWRITPETQQTRRQLAGAKVGKVLVASGKVLGVACMAAAAFAGEAAYGIAVTGR